MQEQHKTDNPMPRLDMNMLTDKRRPSSRKGKKVISLTVTASSIMITSMFQSARPHRKQLPICTASFQSRSIAPLPSLEERLKIASGLFLWQALSCLLSKWSSALSSSGFQVPRVVPCTLCWTCSMQLHAGSRARSRWHCAMNTLNTLK